MKTAPAAMVQTVFHATGRHASIANPTRSKLINTPLRLLAWGARKTTGHRGWLHRAPALVVVWFAGWQLGGPWLGLAYG